MPTLLNFGDLFYYENEEYVFLASSGEVLYAAKILDQNLSRVLIDRYNNLVKNPISRPKLREAIYCFVELHTEGYQSRVAHLHKSDHPSDYMAPDPVGEKLCYEDLIDLKKEILDSYSVIPKGLKLRVKDLEIKKPKK